MPICLQVEFFVLDSSLMLANFADGASAELKAFGHAARESYLQGPAANGSRKPVRGVMTYVDEMASALIEKGRQKVQRLQVYFLGDLKLWLVIYCTASRMLVLPNVKQHCRLSIGTAMLGA